MIKIITVSILAFALIACEKTKPEWEFMPDMYSSTHFKAQKEDLNSKDGAAARVPPAGTIPRGFQPYHFAANEGDKAGRTLINPLVRTKQVLERGQKVFNTYCIVCHGAKGDGQGSVVPPYPRPPTLLSDKIQKWPDGHIFHVITRGQNLMPSYAVQVAPEDRWAVAHYIRALQRAANPQPEDLPASGDQKK
ncbi:MAG: cytochrome c [Oligoflexia bacterium]|nr:cytochrome c [Oligoflexia bacterium]